MTNKVQKLMTLADRYALQLKFDLVNELNGKPTEGAQSHRQNLQDELTRLFTPLPYELLLSRWQITPVLDNLEVEISWADYHTLYEHFVAMHGITVESK